MTRRYLVLVALATMLLGSCNGGGGGGGGGDGVTFHGMQEALTGFSYDTGYQPATPPVQVRLVLSSGGYLAADAQATGSGSAMTPTAGSGVFTMDAHLKVQALVKIDVSGVGSFEGPIPGAPDIDLAFGGQAPFEPFLLDGGTASVTADVPETQLAEIPLGSIPGKLIINALGTITSDFAGVCAQAADGVGQYTGSTTTSGTITLRPTVVLQIPIVGDQTYEIPDVPVTIAPQIVPMDLGIKSLADGSDVAGPGPCGDVPLPDGGTGGDGGGESCALSCAGCCQGNVCRGGDELGACGQGGATCAACSGATPFCVDQTCVGGSSCAQTCPGCCDGETCRGGTSPSACGTGGAACVVCGGSDQCQQGACKGAGSCATTCSGCCVGETCYAGDSATACGAGGATCRTCAANYTCATNHSCEIDPISRWDIYAVDAHIPATDANGDAWDPFSGLPDGFVTISTYVNGQKNQSEDSSVKDDTLTPVWNEVVLPGVLASELKSGGLGFALYDYDPTSYNDLIDSCSGIVPNSDFDGQPHDACGGLIPVRYKILPH